MSNEPVLKKVLHIIPYYELFPPKNGGALRCYNLALQLSGFTELTILTFQPGADFDNSGFEKVRIISVKNKNLKGRIISKLENALKYRWWTRSLKGPAEITFLRIYPELKKLLKQEKFDIVIFEHLHSLKLSGLVKRLSPGTIRIIDQHNVDHVLFSQERDIIHNELNLKIYSRFLGTESSLFKIADYFFACSEKDKATFNVLNQNKIKGFVVPNGVDCKKKQFHEDKDLNNKNILFCGALGTPANARGLIWFYNNVWPILIENISNIHLVVVGKKTTDNIFINLEKESQIVFTGEVEDLAKWYFKSNISIAPLQIGSGTRLKILESMCFGNTVVSTSKGAEGIRYLNDQNIIIRDDPKEFAEAIIHILTDPSRNEFIRRNARTFTEENYCWDMIGQKLKAIINDEL